jgi:hypothetical protein
MHVTHRRYHALSALRRQRSQVRILSGAPDFHDLANGTGQFLLSRKHHGSTRGEVIAQCITLSSAPECWAIHKRKPKPITAESVPLRMAIARGAPASAHDIRKGSQWASSSLTSRSPAVTAV